MSCVFIHVQVREVIPVISHSTLADLEEVIHAVIYQV